MALSYEDWDPFYDPDDADGIDATDGISGTAVDIAGSTPVASSSRPEPVQAYDDPAIAPLIGPLGREVVLDSGRMRDIEAWIERAEAAGLPPVEIAPARKRLLQLGQGNKALQWEAEEQRKKKEQAAAEERKKAQLAKTKERMSAAEQLQRAEAAEVAEDLKAAIMRGFKAGVNVKSLIEARHKLLKIEGRPKPVKSLAQQGPKLRKEDLAKEMLQAMRKKDFVALRAVLDMALQGGVQLPGLQAARSKLQEWEQANPVKAAPKAVPVPTPRQVPEPQPEPPTAQPKLPPKARTPGVVGPDGLLALRVVLPDGRRGWLDMDPADKGVDILTQVLPLKDRAGKVLTDLRFFLANDFGTEGKVRCFRELEMDKPLHAQGFEAGTLLCIRNDLPERRSASSHEGLTCNQEAMARATQVSNLMQQEHQLRVMQARGIRAVPLPRAMTGLAAPSGPPGALWRSALRAVMEPFPAFDAVDRLLGGGRRDEAVVVGWNAVADPVLRCRCETALQAFSASHLVLAGTEGPCSLRQGESFLEVEPDGHFGSEETRALLEHMEKAAGIKPPFLLALVSRGYISRRLAVVLRQYLPVDVPYFACPPADISAALREEVPLFEARIFDEARRLLMLEVELKPEALEALDRLRPGWREHGGRGPQPVS